MNRSIKLSLKLILLPFMGLALMNCTSDDGEIDLSSIPSGGSPTTPVASSDEPLKLGINTVWFNTSDETEVIFNETGTSECVASQTTPVVTCTAAIPEARLYFSSLVFNFSWVHTECKLLRFQPHYYRASVNAAYFPPGATTDIDCASNIGADDEEAACYGGSAPHLIADFPADQLDIFPPDETISSAQTQSAILSSAYVNGAFSNRHAANDFSLGLGVLGDNYTAVQLTDAGSILAGDGYEGSTMTMVDYQFFCRDEFEDAQAYIINLIITDVNEDTGNPVSNDYSTFNHL